MELRRMSTGDIRMSKRLYKIDVPDLNGTQTVLAHKSDFGLYREALMNDRLTFHELAGRISQHFERLSFDMPTEDRLGFAIFRLVQEGLIGIEGITDG